MTRLRHHICDGVIRSSHALAPDPRKLIADFLRDVPPASEPAPEPAPDPRTLIADFLRDVPPASELGPGPEPVPELAPAPEPEPEPAPDRGPAA
jgi:hypothetical protein